MTYYDELGVPPSAPLEEIRHAYKNLARILHPDQYSDETLRRMAELQMKRLNAVYAVLADSAQRRAYDLSLAAAAEHPARAAPEAGSAPAARWRRLLRFSPSDLKFAAWLGGVTVVVAGLFWLLTGDTKPRPGAYSAPAAPQTQPGAPAAAPADPRPSSTEALLKELAHLRRRLQTVEGERDAARALAAGLRGGEPAGAALPERSHEPQTSTPAASLTELAPVPSQTPPAGEPPLATSAPQPGPPAPAASQTARRADGGSRFRGSWFYTPPRLAPSVKSLYPPEYIEVAILEEGGMLRGRYYGRYRVTDRAISPEVIFRFEGRAGEDSAVLEWRGGGGARGEIRLRLLTENSMEVNWSATELGSSPGLAAGTAVLIRRIE